MNVKYRSVQGHVERNELKVIKVPTEDNIADQFTKSLPTACFDELSDQLGFLETDTLWDK